MLPTATVTFGADDVSCLAETATIRHGRGDPSGQPDASTIVVDLPLQIPATVTVGTAVVLDAHLGGSTYRRFTGTVTDIAVTFDDPDHPVTTVIAASPLAVMGRRIIGDTPWAQELDGARVNRAITLAAVPTDALRTDAGTVAVLARDVDAQPAGDIARDVATDAGGMLWGAKDGAVLYADADHRRGAQPKLTLDTCTMPVDIVWALSTEGMANDVRIRYGPADPQDEYHATDTGSIATFGKYGVSLSTQLAAAGDAQARAGMILARSSDPAWVLTGVGIFLEVVSKVIDDDAADLAYTAALLGLEIHDLVSVTGLPAASPYTSAILFVEGWQETISWGSWRLALAVSDFCRTSPEPRWDDVPASYTWDTFPDLTWDEATCVGPIPPSGTWNDVAASLRWDQVDPSITWDTWS